MKMMMSMRVKPRQSDEIVRAISQAELRGAVAAASGPVLVTLWRPWWFMTALSWPVLRRLSASRPDLTVLKVRLAADELPEPELRVRWLPATVLFVEGRVSARWYGGELDFERVRAAIERATEEDRS